jgi:predicted phage-related endonuclease
MTIERRPIHNRTEWLNWRMSDVTASDVSAVLSLHPDRTVARIWAEKTQLIPVEPSSEFLEYRLSLEAAALDWLQRKRPNWEIRRGEVYLRDPELRLGATPDAVAIDPDREGFGIIECKSVVRYIFDRDWKEFENDEMAEAPIWHQLQTITNAMLAGANWSLIVGLILDSGGSGSLKFCPVERNANAEQRIRNAVSLFWAMIDAGRQPPFDYGLDAEVIAALFPKARIKDPPLDLSQDNRLPQILARRQTLKRRAKIIEDGCQCIDTEIKDKLGPFELGTLPGWRISWKTQKRPERITPAWEGRVLRVSQIKDGNNAR